MTLKPLLSVLQALHGVGDPGGREDPGISRPPCGTRALPECICSLKEELPFPLSLPPPLTLSRSSKQTDLCGRDSQVVNRPAGDSQTPHNVLKAFEAKGKQEYGDPISFPGCHP